MYHIFIYSFVEEHLISGYYEQNNNEQKAQTHTKLMEFVLCWLTTSWSGTCPGVGFIYLLTLSWRKHIFLFPSGIDCKQPPGQWWSFCLLTLYGTGTLSGLNLYRSSTAHCHRLWVHMYQYSCYYKLLVSPFIWIPKSGRERFDEDIPNKIECTKISLSAHWQENFFITIF